MCAPENQSYGGRPMLALTEPSSDEEGGTRSVTEGEISRLAADRRTPSVSFADSRLLRRSPLSLVPRDVSPFYGERPSMREPVPVPTKLLRLR